MRYFFISCTAIICASTASAHVSFQDKAVTAGEFHEGQIGVFHGCDGSPTVSVRVELPQGLKQVRPRALAGWTLEIEKERLDHPYMLHGEEVTERVSAIIWKSGRLPDYAYQKFSINMRLPNEPGRALGFPVYQSCETGELNWVETSANGKNPEHPMPSIKLLPQGLVKQQPRH